MKNKLKDVYDKKNNSFTILSIIMSIMIIYYHCYPLFFGITSKKRDIFTEFMGISLGEVIVGAFFVISGFMIVTSLNNSKNIGNYFKKRFIRIFPPLIFCLLVCALVIAPILSDIPKWEFLKNTKLYSKYIFDNIFLWKNTQYGIADVFINNPYPAAINGSIWTIKHQFFMYILIVVINFAILKKHKEYYKYFFYVLLIVTMVSFTGKYDAFFKDLTKNFNDIGILVEGNQLLKLICYFCAGVFINIYSEQIVIKKKYAAFSLFLLILCRKTMLVRCLCLLVIPYVTIYLGTLKFNIKLTDISYQIYIWAFPIQQMIMYYLNGKIDIYVYILLSICITSAVAFLTYYITEWPFVKLRNPDVRYKLYNKWLWIAPKVYTHKKMYKDHLNKKLNLNNPVDFNEKLHYLILYKYGKKEGMLADKIAVKDYILSKNINGLLVPKTLKVYNNVREINLDDLPNTFVLKCNHSSGNVVICNDKKNFDLANAKSILQKVLKQNFAKTCYEYHYKYIKPTAYAEEYLNDHCHKNPLDYKIYCSNGKAQSILVCSERENSLKLSEYDLEWNKIDCIVDDKKSSVDIPKPKNLDKMIRIAEQIAEDIPFVRVDLYEIDNKIYFGELTFSPAAGICNYYTEDGLIEHGKYIDLSLYD